MNAGLAKNEMKLVVYTPYKRLLEEVVNEVYVPTESGYIDIYPDHAAMLTNLGTGVLFYTYGTDVTGFYKISGGVAEVTDKNELKILADIAEEASTIDHERAKKALERALGRIQTKDASSVDISRADAARLRAQARLEAFEKYKATLGNKH